MTGSIFDFWLSSGHLLLDRDEHGRLVVTDPFLKLYLARPEMVPPAEACDAERALHARLLADPRATIEDGRIDALADADARHNWRVLLAFRDHLLAHPSIEAAYLGLMRQGVGQTPPLFIDQLVHVVARTMLDGATDPVMLRAAELLWRPQRLTRENGGLLLADQEVADGVRNSAAADAHASPLIAMLGEHTARNLDVLTDTNAGDYFKRSDAHDLVLDFRTGGPGRAALGRVVERWLAHMLGLAARVTPLERIDDQDWFWFVGLDAEATRIGNALWAGKTVDRGALDRIVALYALDIEGVPVIAGRTIHLILAMTRDQVVRLKPQNLLVGLPPALTGPARDGGRDGQR